VCVCVCLSRMVCKGIFFSDEVLVRYFRIQRQRETRLHYKTSQILE